MALGLPLSYVQGDIDFKWRKIMADRIIEKHVYHSDGEGDGGSSGALGALAVVLMVLLVLVVLYFTGVLGRWFGPSKTKVDINVQKPGIVMVLK